MRRASLIGRCEMTDADLPILGEIIRSEASIHAAVGTLSNPWQRIQHRLFWFHCQPPHQDPAEKAHDGALRGLIAAYAGQQDETGPMLAALKQWHEFVAQPQYWKFLNKIDCDLGFEPAVDAGEISALHDKAIALAAEPFVEAARNAWLNKDLAAFHDYLAAFAALEATGHWAVDCRQNLIVPLNTQLVDACETLASKYRTQIVHQDDAASANEHVCAGELQYYRGFVETAWKELAAVLMQNEPEVRLGRGQTADCLGGVALDHTWANQFVQAQDLAIEATRLAVGTIVEPRLRETLRKLVEAGEKRREGECADAIATFRSVLATFHDSYPARALPDKPGINDKHGLCTQALRFYRDSVEPALNLVVKLSEDTQRLTECHAHAARCLAVIATEFAWASEFAVAEEVSREAFALASGTEAAGEIQDGLARLPTLIEMQRRNTSRQAVDAAVAALRQHFATIARTFDAKIVANERFVQENRLVCAEELAYFRSQIEPAFHELLARLQPYDQVLLGLKEQAAVCLAGIATHHTWADESMVAERLMEESLTLAQGTWAAPAIQKNYLWMRKSARTEPLKMSSGTVSIPSLTAMTWVFGIAAALFSMMAVSRTASTTAPRPVLGGNTTDRYSVSSPPVFENRQEEPQVPSAKNVAERLEGPIQRLQDEIELLKKERAAGDPVDSNLLNTKLYQYSSLVRKRRRALQLLNQEAEAANKQP